MVSKQTAGFTLIETTIAMTLSSALAIIAIFGFSSMRSQAEFSNGIDALKEQVTSVRTEAYTTVNLSGAGNSSNIVLGRLMTFTSGSSDVAVSKIIAPDDVNQTSIVVQPDHVFTLPWGIYFNTGAKGTVYQVAFFRSKVDGSNITSYSPAGGFTPVDYPTLDNGITAGTTFQFIDTNGRKAVIGIDPSSNGVIRSFQ